MIHVLAQFSINLVSTLVGLTLLILSAATGVIGYLRANVSKSTIELYKIDNDALRGRVDTLEGDLRRCNENHRVDATEIANLKTAHANLVSVVTQKEAITELLHGQGAIREQLAQIEKRIEAITR